MPSASKASYGDVAGPRLRPLAGARGDIRDDRADRWSVGLGLIARVERYPTLGTFLPLHDGQSELSGLDVALVQQSLQLTRHGAIEPLTQDGDVPPYRRRGAAAAAELARLAGFTGLTLRLGLAGWPRCQLRRFADDGYHGGGQPTALLVLMAVELSLLPWAQRIEGVWAGVDRRGVKKHLRAIVGAQEAKAPGPIQARDRAA